MTLDGMAWRILRTVCKHERSSNPNCDGMRREELLAAVGMINAGEDFHRVLVGLGRAGLVEALNGDVVNSTLLGRMLDSVQRQAAAAQE